jgi:hypothetical protein
MTIQHHPQERPADSRPLTYDDAQSAYQSSLHAARDRYAELSDRGLCARSVALLRERGEFSPQNPGHQSLAQREPMSAADHLEHMALGEVLARYYRHPSMLDLAAKAGASWEQIGAARGTSAEQARQDYRAWADGQHSLLSYGDGRFGMSDADYAASLARASRPEPASGPSCGLAGDPEVDDPNPGWLYDSAGRPVEYAGEPEPSAGKAYAVTHPVLCAHADRDGTGSHWLEPGERCAGLGRAEADQDPEAGQLAGGASAR